MKKDEPPVGRFADEALLALAVAGMFAACDWYETRNEKRAPSGTRKARSGNA